MQNEPRYVDENIQRCVRSCRRAKSLDEESDNDNKEYGGLRSVNGSRNSTTSMNFDTTTSQYLKDTTRTSGTGRLRSDDVEQQTTSRLKRMRSRWTSDPLFRGRSIEEQSAVDDLLSLDNDDGQSMDVDRDHEEGQTLHHNYRNEFAEISNELHSLCFSDDDPKTRALSKPTSCQSNSTSVGSTPRHSVMMLSTAEKETCDRNYWTGSDDVAEQLLAEKNRSCSPDCHSNESQAIGETVVTDPNYHCWNSVSVSHPESVFRQHADQHRPKLNEIGRSKLVLSSSVNSLPPLQPASNVPASESTANLCLLKSDITPNAVSVNHIDVKNTVLQFSYFWHVNSSSM